MTGSIHKRATTKLHLKPGEFSWSIILQLGRDPITGKYKQHWITYHGTRNGAKQRLREILAQTDRGEFVEPTKLTLGAWLESWLSKIHERVSPRTRVVYRNAVVKHISTSHIGAIQLQRLTPSDIESYHHSKSRTLAHATLNIHQAVLTSSLDLAKRDKLVRDNVAREATQLPMRLRKQRVLRAWTVEEAQRVLAAAEAAGAQTAAFFAVALHSGARKGELQAIRWTDINVSTGAIRIERQLLQGGASPIFGETKTRRERFTQVDEDTLQLLHAHKRKQAELKMANRLHYADHDLVFAQELEHQGHGGFCRLGAPLSSSTIARMLERLVKQAEVRRINVHGLRHTCATLLLAANVQSKVVQERLGHQNIATTLNLYAHVLEGQQADAAARLSSLLSRKKA